MVNDGEALLRQVYWSGTAFKERINENRRYPSSKYMIFQIVFDE